MKTKVKKEVVKMQLGVALTLPKMLSLFKTPTYGDMQRIDGLMRLLNQQEQTQGDAIKAFFEKNGLEENQSVGPSHPLFHQLEKEVLGSVVEITKDQTQVFNQEQFNSSIDGLEFNYQERSMLQFWLVKEA